MSAGSNQPGQQAAGAPARDQAPAAAQEPTGTGRITVLVVASDTGAPVKRVHLGIYGMVGMPTPGGGVQTSSPSGGTAFVVIGGSVASGPSGPGRVQKEAETDENGRAEFTSLPPGVYSVMVRSSPAGFVRPIASQSVPIKEGEAGSQTIRLLRGGAIMGRIVDEAGDPLSRVSVRAVAKDAGNGMPRFAGAGMPANTDDRGQFRIFDLPPGDYYVSATLFMQSMGDPAVAQRAEPKIGYLPTFYPGAPALDGAQAVGVKSGQETAGIDFGMLRGRLGRISGTALDSNGAPFPTRGGSIMLSPRSREMAASGRGASLRPDGTFVIPDVPPGDYYVSASLYDTAGATGGGAVSTREGAFVPVTVTGDEVVVDIRTNRGATLSGRIVREGPMPPPPVMPGTTPRMPPPQAMRVSVGVRPPTGASMSPGTFDPGKSEYFDADNTFQIKGARGSVMITASSGVGVVKSIRRGAKDLLAVPLELTGTEEIDDIEIVLTTDTGSLTGTVTDRRGQPAAGAWVLVFPDDPEALEPALRHRDAGDDHGGGDA